MTAAIVTWNRNRLIELINNPIITTSIKRSNNAAYTFAFFFFCIKLEIALQYVSLEPVDAARDPEYGRCYDFISIMSSIL